ncbi:hypothetical protein ACH5RR_001096 [Cinchona calisaya]|uniref:Uncharacterized protein n=1 Tax=Cinchona calisaya TaxID=153742 RepID=A0ABD3B2H1_9GENT
MTGGDSSSAQKRYTRSQSESGLKRPKFGLDICFTENDPVPDRVPRADPIIIHAKIVSSVVADPFLAFYFELQLCHSLHLMNSLDLVDQSFDFRKFPSGCLQEGEEDLYLGQSIDDFRLSEEILVHANVVVQ